MPIDKDDIGEISPVPKVNRGIGIARPHKTTKIFSQVIRGQKIDNGAFGKGNRALRFGNVADAVL